MSINDSESYKKIFYKPWIGKISSATAKGLAKMYLKGVSTHNVGKWLRLCLNTKSVQDTLQIEPPY